MSLTSASSLNSITWSQQKLNPGFNPTYQGPESFTYSNVATIAETGTNSVYAVQGTLAPLASTTLDLQNLTDFFGEALVFTRLYTMQVQVVGAPLQIGPGAVDPCQFFFGSVTDRIAVKPDSNFMYSGDYPFEVTNTGKTLDLYNESATEPLTYKLVIIGGQGAGTTSTTSTSATTVSSSTTGSPSTSTASP